MPGLEEVSKPLRQQAEAILHLAKDMELMSRHCNGTSDRWLPQDEHRMERALKAFWRDYSKAMREVEEYTKSGIELDVIDQIRICHQEFLHEKENRPWYGLDIPCEMSLASEQSSYNRIFLAARLHWLELREQQGIEKYPTESWDVTLELDRTVLLEKVSEKNKWIIDWTVPLSWETGMLINLAQLSMDFQIHGKHMAAYVMNFATEQNLTRVPRVGVISTPSLLWVVSPDDKVCHICSSKFGHSFDAEALTEPAVRTRCGHIVGMRCLQTWINTGSATCPFCRRALYEKEITLPEDVLLLYRKIFKICGELRQQDGLIDTWLLQGPQDIYRDERFLPCMKTILQWTWHYYYLVDEIWKMLTQASIQQNPGLKPDARSYEVEVEA